MTGRTARRWAACGVIVGALTGLTALMAPAGWFERVDGVVTDLAFPRGQPDGDIAVVAIDERALADVEPSWPWPRRLHAELIHRLANAGADVVVLDLVLAASTPDDGQLAAAMTEVPTVLASTASGATSDAGQPVSARKLVRPDPVLVASAAAVGHAQVVADPADGVARTVPLVIESSDRRLSPALSLATLAVRGGADPRPILRPSGVEVGDQFVPTDDRYRMRVSWPEGLPPTPGSPGQVLSAADVLAGTFPAKVVAGRIVLVGVTDPTLGDQTATPVSKRTPDPGVMVQAAALHTMTSRNFLDGPSVRETLLWVAFLSFAAAASTQFLPLPVTALVVSGLLIVAVVVPVQRAGSGTLLFSVYPAIAVAIAVPLSGAARYLFETRLRRQVTTMFAQYVPPPVAEELVRAGRLTDAVEGQRLEVTVLFCDLRGFTPMAASLEPSQVNRLLSEFYEFVSETVLAEGGTIMQYVGDEVFAVFGAPVGRSDHAAAGLHTAITIQSRRAVLLRRLERLALPPIRFGIGLNSGEVVAAHTGSSFRRQYALIGDTVNVGSRLCGQAGEGEVVAASSTVALAGGPPERVTATQYRPTMKGVQRDFEAWCLRIPDATSE